MRDNKARERIEQLEKSIQPLLGIEVKHCNECGHATLWENIIFDHWHCLTCGTKWVWQSVGSWQKEED